MIFQHTCDAVLNGTKTQTRRLVKPEHIAAARYMSPIHAVMRRVPENPETGQDAKYVWQVGNTYAVQPGRGKKAVGRIRITAIRRERLQDITPEDIRAEGWGLEHPPLQFGENYCERLEREFFAGEYGWNGIHTKPGTRWEDNPEVWVLEFELCASS